ncbi:TPA: ead/Ea22-like family protein [Escherichia coli]|nr:ead/Ea22-like family protein [Escherichia coli]
MSKIDYQKLREIAEKTKIAGEAPVMPFDQRINALNDFMKHFSPDIALALLDERERNQQYIKLRDQENEEIALTVGKLRVELEAAEKRIAELQLREVVLPQCYPVNPDGWISCSERMPDTKTAVLVAKEFDRKGDWRMKWATYIPGHPDANDGWIIPGASWKPSHWMPLPEPPQEVNRG